MATGQRAAVGGILVGATLENNGGANAFAILHGLADIWLCIDNQPTNHSPEMHQLFKH